MASAVQAGVTQEGGVLVSFEGSTGGDLLSGTAIFGKGDFDLTDQLLACAVRDHNIDPKRVFATGCSAGGLFSGAMAAARSNYMAAAAPNSGGWTAPVGWQNMWTPALMTIHGAPGGDVVIVDFSMTSMTADNAFKQRGGFVINCNHGGGHCGGGGLAKDIWEFFKAHPYGTSPSPWKDALPSGFNPVCKIM
jgi:poly(3-hydroxybutyrate) depolymerase